MTFIDKIKKTANTVKTKAVDFAEEKNLDSKINNVKESTKKVFSESAESLKNFSKENKEMKKPLEGAYRRYEVIYIGGLPQYPKTKHGNAIGLNIMPDRFVFTKTTTSKDWFEDFDIEYSRIKDIYIEKRTISTAEMLLGGGNDANQQQENNICITFVDNNNIELMLRVEMLTGGTIYNQTAKCREFLDLLRQKGIWKQIQDNDKPTAAYVGEDDILGKIEKMARLKDAGILTEEEFNQKKTELLEKL